MSDLAQDPALQKALGLEEYEWTSPDGNLSCTYGRPSGFISDTIDILLGPTQVGNRNLWAKYYAISGIRTWTGPDKNGETTTRKAIPPSDALQFITARNRFESDENYLDFVGQYHAKLNPELQAKLEEIKDAIDGTERAEQIHREVADTNIKA